MKLFYIRFSYVNGDCTGTHEMEVSAASEKDAIELIEKYYEYGKVKKYKVLGVSL